MTNIVIFKQLKKEVKSNYANFIAIISSQKLAVIKISNPKISYLTLLLTELLPKTIVSILFFFSPTLKDDDMKDIMIVYGYKYKLHSMFSISKKKYI